MDSQGALQRLCYAAPDIMLAETSPELQMRMPFDIAIDQSSWMLGPRSAAAALLTWTAIKYSINALLLNTVDLHS